MVVELMADIVSLFKDIVVTLVLVICVSITVREGLMGCVRKLLLVVRQLPGVNWVISWLLRREVRGFLRQLDPQAFKPGSKQGLPIPKQGEEELCFTVIKGIKIYSITM